MAELLNCDGLAEIYNQLRQGNKSILSFDLFERLSRLAVYYINSDFKWSYEDKATVLYILNISDILYNNSSQDQLPLDDGVYDQLLVKFKSNDDYDLHYNPGAVAVKFDEVSEDIEETKLMVNSIPKDQMERALYTEDIMKQYTSTDPRLVTMCTIARDPISKRLINATPKYPELVGTLDKCKFVLNIEAERKGLIDKPSVQIFERDFIQKHIQAGILDPNEEFTMIAELKYDGVSVEASVIGDTIVSAFSRGDTAENLATDLTPLLGGYKFRNAKDVPTDKEFGIKFEAIITKYDLQRLTEMRGKPYKNCRNAIIGLFGSSDAYKYRDLITLVPLSTSLDIDRLDEIEFLNKYYSSGQYNRYSVLKGNYVDVLYLVSEFTRSAEIVRPVMPYLYDGVVISYVDRDKIETLGRVNSVNKYSIAIKFNPKKNRTIFLGYTFTVGKTGNITPMAHFKPCEFIGTIHDKQTVHSYKRFKELGLRKYDEIDVEYMNEVICYVTKPETAHNTSNNNPLEEFPTVCPICGAPLTVSSSEDSMSCLNPMCEGRCLGRMTDMIKKLGFKDFSEETIKTLGIKSFKELINLRPDQTIILGPTNQVKFHNCIQNVMTNPISDYLVMSALGFDNVGNETWKTILYNYTIKELLELFTKGELVENLVKLDSIGEVTAITIDNKFTSYCDDIAIIVEMNNIVNSKGIDKGPKVAITGFRDPDFIELLNNHGFDASDSYGVSKKISYLVAADPNSNSSKITKAKKLGIPILSMSEFLTMSGINL
jgi:DNA ligase (NAD+)